MLSLVDRLQLAFELLHFRNLGTLRILALRFLAVRATSCGLPRLTVSVSIEIVVDSLSKLF